MSATSHGGRVPSPRAWVRLALLGSFVYLASQIMRFFPAAASRATRLSAASLAAWLPVASGAGLVLLFAGLVVAFWRVNRVAGHTGAGVLGLVAGTVGIFLLTVFDILALFAALSLQSPLLAALGSVSALGGLVATFLTVAGLSLLGLGLTHALWLREAEPAEEAADVRSELGSSGYRSY